MKIPISSKMLDSQSEKDERRLEVGCHVLFELIWQLETTKAVLFVS